MYHNYPLALIHCNNATFRHRFHAARALRENGDDLIEEK